MWDSSHTHTHYTINQIGASQWSLWMITQDTLRLNSLEKNQKHVRGWRFCARNYKTKKGSLLPKLEVIMGGNLRMQDSSLSVK